MVKVSRKVSSPKHGIEFSYTYDEPETIAECIEMIAGTGSVSFQRNDDGSVSVTFHDVKGLETLANYALKTHEIASDTRERNLAIAEKTGSRTRSRERFASLGV